MKKILLNLALATFGLVAGSNAQTTIFSQDFTSAVVPALPTGWTKTTVANTGTTPDGWVTTNASTTLYSASASNAAPHTQYAVVNEYNVPGNNLATMTSPTFSLSGVASAYLKYDYVYEGVHITGTDTFEHAWVEISADGGTTWSVLDSVDAATSWATKYANMSSYAGSPNCQIRFKYTDGGAALVGVAIGNVSVFVPNTHDVSLVYVAPVAKDVYDYYTTGTAINFSGIVFNNSSSTVSSFPVTYQVGTATAVTSTVTATVAPFTYYSFTCSSPYTVSTLGSLPVKIWISAPSDTTNGNDTMNTAIYGVASVPTKRLMYEEGTGAWCGYCVRGIIYMDSLWHVHGDNVSIAAVHDHGSGDDMSIENTLTQHYDNFISSLVSGFPTVVVDRRGSGDPTDAFTYYDAWSNKNFGFANISATGTFTSSSINVSTTVTPALNLTGDYRVELVITEDSVHGTTSGYSQHNYYSYSIYNLPLSGEGYNFQDSAGVIPGKNLYYKFVDRYTVPDMVSSPNGVASSLPATMTSGTAYNYTFAAVTPTGIATWNVNHLRAIVLLIDNNANNPTYGQILNSTVVSHVTSVANVTAGVDEISVFPNPARNDAHVRFDLKNAGKVSFSVVDVLGRTVFSAPAEEMNAGGQQINFSTGNFAPGMYNITIATATGVVTEKLSIVK